jgi:hypothetical protein
MEVNGQLHAPAALPPRKYPPVTHWIGGWVDPRVGLDAVEKRKLLQCRESNPGRPARNPSLYRLSYPNSSLTCKAGNFFIGWVTISLCFARTSDNQHVDGGFGRRCNRFTAKKWIIVWTSLPCWTDNLPHFSSNCYSSVDIVLILYRVHLSWWRKKQLTNEDGKTFSDVLSPLLRTANPASVVHELLNPQLNR